MTNGARDDWSDDNWVVGALFGVFLLAGIAAYALDTGDRLVVASAPTTTSQVNPATLPN